MYTPLQSLYIKGQAGDPIPQVFSTLEERGTKFMRGQVVLICAGPGVGKSAFVLTLAMKANVNTLYFSADSDAFTQLSRMVSITTEWPLSKSQRKVRDSDLADISGDLDIPIRFSYQSQPTTKQIALTMEAFAEVYESYPELVVVDNITNVRCGGLNDDDPFAGLEVLLEFLHTLARDTGACVVGLHHVTGPYNDANQPIPLSGVKGQIARIPEMVLTLHRDESFGATPSLRVSTVKNRNGKADPSGKDFAELQFVGETMQIKDFAR